MKRWQTDATAVGVTAVGTVAVFVLAAQTDREAYALAGLIGTAMTAGLFLRYLHTLVAAHAAPTPTDLAESSGECLVESSGEDLAELSGECLVESSGEDLAELSGECLVESSSKTNTDRERVASRVR